MIEPIQTTLQFTLTDGERTHPLWKKLSDHFEDRLRDARGRNDGALSKKETARVRGQIGLLKSLIALGDTPPIIDG